MTEELDRDNPFRPEGELAKEANEIVESLKSGKITESVISTSGRPSPVPPSTNKVENGNKEVLHLQQTTITSSTVAEGGTAAPTTTTTAISVSSGVNKKNEIERVTIPDKKHGCCSIV